MTAGDAAKECLRISPFLFLLLLGLVGCGKKKIAERQKASRIRGTLLRYLLAFLARLERTADPPGAMAGLPQISPMEPIKTPFPRPSGAPLNRAALHNALRRLNLAGDTTASGPSLRKRLEPLSSVGILSQ